jgi:hypothetical protein
LRARYRTNCHHKRNLFGDAELVELETKEVGGFSLVIPPISVRRLSSNANVSKSTVQATTTGGSRSETINERLRTLKGGGAQISGIDEGLDIREEAEET